MSNYLLEIGVEEFPAKYIKSTQEQLKKGINNFLEKNNYKYETFSINSTPRRFSIIIRGIEENQKQLFEKVKGPSKKIAFDDEGNPTKALQGFLRSKNLTSDDITIEKINGEDYIYANIKSKSKTLDDVLKDSIPETIKSVSNPRQMKWGGKNIRFLRPIRWIVSILDDKVLKFEFEGIKVSNTTKGHRTLGSSNIIINKIDEYEDLLKQNYVIVSEKERRKIIIIGLNRLSKEKGGHYHEDEELLEELIHINEYPTPFIGEFNNEYLKLPKEIIITPMKDHQRYFPVEDDNSNLLPYFIGVRNGDEKGIENVIAGNEKVLVARLEDAKFFFTNDISMPLQDYVPKLASLGYHDGLGSMLDKTNRLEKLVESISDKIDCGEEVENIAKRAAYLSKADLVTSTVIEFTELQGVMGKIFAQYSDENSLVAQAIEEQYMPLKAGAELPNTTGGMILSLAEKIDTISGLHSKGIEVTGSQDLYGQRRAVLGILNILLNKKIEINLEDIIRDSLYNYVESFGETFNYEEVVNKILEFIKQRFRNMLVDKNYRYDIIDSILEAHNLNIIDMYEKIKVISDWSDNSNFDEQITKLIRIVNISEKAENDYVNVEYLQAEDGSIYGELNNLDEIDSKINLSQYNKAVELLNSVINVINNYLDGTMIMVEDNNIRNNRLAMIKKVSDRILKIFNPTKIVRDK